MFWIFQAWIFTFSAVLQGARFDYFHIIAIEQEGRFPDTQESLFEGAEISNKGSAVQQWCWFADDEESRIQAMKRSEICTAVLQGGRFADSQESWFQSAIR